MYTIDVSGTCFQLSGASLSYDSPSLFTEFFCNNPGVTRISIDRSPKIFEIVSMHLQGYSIKINDDFEWIYLLTDANFFNLSKLKDRLYQEPLFVNVSTEIFKIPKEILFNPKSGNYPNYFTIIYENLIRDPAITLKNNVLQRPLAFTPIVTNKDPAIFKELLGGLYGNEIVIKNEQHRRDLLRDCKYYQFNQLEQRIIPVTMIKNPFTKYEEIVIKFDDIKKKGLLNDALNHISEPFSRIKYSRPHLDTNLWRDLVVQFDNNIQNMDILINPVLKFFQIACYGQFANKMRFFLQEFSDDYRYNKDTNELNIYCDINNATGILNGLEMDRDWLSLISQSDNIKQDPNKVVIVKLLKSQWRFNVTGRNKLWMDCVKFDGVLDELHFNQSREFL